MSSDKLILTIDKNVVDEYNRHYMKFHPRAINVPMTKRRSVKLYNKDGSPSLTNKGNHRTKSISVTKGIYTKDDCLYGAMSLNEILAINSTMQIRGVKSKWKDFGVWLAKYYKLDNKLFTNSLIEFRFYAPTKAKRDCDNLSAGIKFLNDGLFVESKMFKDDNFEHINPLVITAGVDKLHPRTEIRISLFDTGVDDIYKKMEGHINNFK